MLEIKNLKVELDAEAGLVRAIDGMRLTLQRGETFALVGESGCGKSMTALALMRLLPENGWIAEGDILVDGQDVVSLPESGMRSVRGGRIGMIFQEPSTSLNPVMKVGDQLVEAIETHTALRGQAAREKAVDWLRKVGIPEPETFMPLPWDSRVARVWCQCFRNREEREDPASFLTSDCRGNLKRLQGEFEESTGLGTVVILDSGGPEATPGRPRLHAVYHLTSMTYRRRIRLEVSATNQRGEEVLKGASA